MCLWSRPLQEEGLQTLAIFSDGNNGVSALRNESMRLVVAGSTYASSVFKTSVASDLKRMLDQTVMDKLLLVPVHKPDQLDSLQALNLDLSLYL